MIKASIVGGIVVAACLGFDEGGSTLSVTRLAPGESDNQRGISLPAVDLETNDKTSAKGEQPPTKFTLVLGVPGRGGNPSLSDVFALARFIEDQPQTVFADLRFDRKPLAPPREVEFDDPSKLMQVVDRTLGEFGAFVVRGSTMWIARDLESGGARDAAFLAVKDLHLVSAARPAVVVVAAKGDPVALLTRFVEAKASDRVHVGLVGSAKLLSVTGPAGELGFVATALAEGLATSASSKQVSYDALFERPNSSDRRLVLQFDEIEGTTMKDFVDACRANDYGIDRVPNSVVESRIRIFPRIVIPADGLGDLIEDIARALSLVVTLDGNRRRLWDPDEFAEAQALAAQELGDSSRDPFAVAVDFAAIESWGDRTVWIEVDVPLSVLTPERALALLRPLLVDPIRDGDFTFRGSKLGLRGPAHVVVRNAEILTAAEALLIR